MKRNLTLLAMTLCTLCSAPVFAEGDDARIQSDTYLQNDIRVRGRIEAEGRIYVQSESAATVDQDQTTLFNESLGDGDHEAEMTDNAMAGAEGNIGVNVSAGVGNAQSNDAAISTIDGEDVFASAAVFNSQTSALNYGTTGAYDTNYRATLDGDALRDAKGNIGVNIAAGVGNAQSNGMAASVNSSGSLAKAIADSEQFAEANLLDSLDGDLDVFASLSGNALAGAQGNIGVNVASGVGNLQHNGLAIAVASCGTCTPPPCTTGCGP